MFAFEIIAERRIKEAIKRGDLDNLAGMGKPLPRDGLDNVPDELRAACIILKNAGVLPEELELKKCIITLKDLLACCRDSDEEKILRTRLNEKQLRYRMLVERRGCNVDSFYYNRILEKLE